MKNEVHLIAVDLEHEPWLALTVEDVERYLRRQAAFDAWWREREASR